MDSSIYRTVYGPLPLTGDSIRILTVLEASSDPNLIQCHITVASLADEPSYTALSYTWGTEPFDHSVQVNSTTVSVTKSCYDALKTYRDDWFKASAVLHQTTPTSTSVQTFQRNAVKTLWIDQLSIDQSNLNERSSQILLMRDIFFQAKVVWTWLGPSPTSEPSNPTEGSAAAALRLLQFLNGRQVATVKWRDAGIPAELDTAFSWTALWRLLACPYFTRRWIVQEVSLNSNAFIFLDHSLVDIALIEGAASFIEINQIELSHAKGFNAARSVRDNSTSINTVMACLRSVGDTRRRNTGSQISLGQFLWLLTECMPLETGKVHDIFYAMRSFAPPVMRLSQPDYGFSVQSMCIEHAIAFIENGYGPQILQLSGFGLQCTSGLPSWCPDWMSPGFHGSVTSLDHSRRRHEPFWKPSLFKSCEVVSENPSLLRVHTRRVDTIKAVFQSNWKTPLGKFFHFVQAHEMLWKPCEYISSVINQIERVSRESIQQHGGRFNGLGRLELGLQSLLVPVSDTTLQDGAFHAGLIYLWHCLAFYPWDPTKHMIATTEMCSLGLVPRATKSGDSIVIVPGASLPLVIRPRPRPNVYAVVGDAFIFGLLGRSYLPNSTKTLDEETQEEEAEEEDRKKGVPRTNFPRTDGLILLDDADMDRLETIVLE